MAGASMQWLPLLLFFTVFLSKSHSLSLKTYVVHMDKSAMPDSFSDHLDWYSSLVNRVIVFNPENEVVERTVQRIIYSYENVFHGVAARLTEKEAERLEEEDGVLAIFPETKYQLHTTRSPKFLGLESLEMNSQWSHKLSGPDHDVVVGVLDTGIWPESESFNDAGMPPAPATFKGVCETGRGFTKQHCNKKVVGARIFHRGYEAATGKFNEELEYKSPRDQDGHGTHTAATVAGSPVAGASLLGYAYGTARGMAPAARIAVYKVCWVGGCFSSDIMAAVDRAVSDGVNVLSISLGGGVSSYYRDGLAVAAFGATEMGVFVSCSAGNGGPDPVTLTNVAPWITTVGASTMDRDFPATVHLGNGRKISGVSLYKGTRTISPNKQFPVIYMGSNKNNSNNPDPSSLCLEGTLDPQIVSGKIVICDRGISPRVQKGQVVKNAGGIGMILANIAGNGEELVADCHLLPAVAVGAREGREIKNYVATNRKPTATVEFSGTRLGVRPSPVVAAFSSRGPNFLSLEILKPDLIAPGVNILAAWTGKTGPSSLSTDPRRVKFNILSGTSMSCPHVSGVGALIKSKHPEWSPSAIKSALMTTAYVHDNTYNLLRDAGTGAGRPSSPYDHGAGHINPRKALDPGLVYEIEPQDYFDFLCTQDLTPAQLEVFSKYSKRTCRNVLKNPGDLNYPAISAVFPANASSLTLHRTVTNVGASGGSYRVVVTRFKGAAVRVEPESLNFTHRNEKMSYRISFLTRSRQTAPEFGGLVWKDGTHKVRSPIVITWLSSV